MMDQCYFPSCYRVHYCFNYQHSDNGYPCLISSSCSLMHASVNQLQYECHIPKKKGIISCYVHRYITLMAWMGSNILIIFKLDYTFFRVQKCERVVGDEWSLQPAVAEVFSWARIYRRGNSYRSYEQTERLCPALPSNPQHSATTKSTFQIQFCAAHQAATEKNKTKKHPEILSWCSKTWSWFCHLHVKYKN